MSKLTDILILSGLGLVAFYFLFRREGEFPIGIPDEHDIYFPIQDLYVPPEYYDYFPYKRYYEAYREPSPEFEDWYFKSSGLYPQDWYFPPHYGPENVPTWPYLSPDYYYFMGNKYKRWYPNIYDTERGRGAVTIF